VRGGLGPRKKAGQDSLPFDVVLTPQVCVKGFIGKRRQRRYRKAQDVTLGGCALPISTLKREAVYVESGVSFAIASNQRLEVTVPISLRGRNWPAGSTPSYPGPCGFRRTSVESALDRTGVEASHFVRIVIGKSWRR
jgi:hypothetical protein